MPFDPLRWIKEGAGERSTCYGKESAVVVRRIAIEVLLDDSPECWKFESKFGSTADITFQAHAAGVGFDDFASRR